MRGSGRITERARGFLYLVTVLGCNRGEGQVSQLVQSICWTGSGNKQISLLHSGLGSPHLNKQKPVLHAGADGIIVGQCNCGYY